MTYTKEQLIELWEHMVNGRAFDRAMCIHNPLWHEGRGEEASVVGAFHFVGEDDVVAPHFRGATVLSLMRGTDPEVLAAGIFGKAKGLTRGAMRGDINALPSRNVIGLYSGTLGTSVSYATGAALNMKQQGKRGVVVCSFGDGTSNSGLVAESWNMAKMLNLPIVYILQNNQYATSLHADVAIAGGTGSDRARAYGMPTEDVDGNDVIAVSEAVQRAADHAREHGPAFVHAVTYRMGGHYMSDPEVYRSREEVEEWEQKDPIVRLEKVLVEEHGWSADEAATRRQQIEERFEEIVKASKELPAPELDDISLSPYTDDILAKEGK